MADLTIKVPEDLARRLAGIAAAEHKSVQQLAIEQLSSLAELKPGIGSAATALRAMHEPPHLSPADVDELDAAIAGGRLPLQPGDIFQA